MGADCNDLCIDSLRREVPVRHWAVSSKAQLGILVRDDGTEGQS